MKKLLTTLIASGVLLTLLGCGQKIAEEKTQTGIDKNDVRSLSFDAFTHDYELNVEYRSTGSVVTVAVFKKADVPELAQVDMKKALTSSTSRENKLVQKIEKGTPVSVIIMNAEAKTDVWTKIWSK